MKRTILFLTAISMLALTGCSEQQNISETPPEIINETEAPTEPVFMEYNDEDFTHIEVALNKQKDVQPPIGVESFEFKEVEVPTAMSPCKLPENRELFIEVKRFFYERWHNDMEDFEPYINNICNFEAVGRYAHLCCGDGKVAFTVNFDDYCDTWGSHCESVYEYDTETDKLTEIYRYEDSEISEDINELKYFGGELYILRDLKKFKDVTEDGNTYRMNFDYLSQNELIKISESGTVSPTVDFDGIQTDKAYIFFDRFCGDRLLLHVRNFNEGRSNDDIQDEIYEYDTEKNELTKIYEGGYADYFTRGDLYAYSETDDNKKLSVVSNNFRLNTGRKGAVLEAFTGNRVAVTVTDTASSWLYTYDLDKMECYESNIMGIGNNNAIFSLDNNLILSVGSSYTYLIPELGATFNAINFTAETGVHGEWDMVGDELCIVFYDGGYSVSSDGYITPAEKPLKKMFTVK